METTRKPIPSKRERMRKIKAIQANVEAQRRALGLKAPSMKKGPAFYLGVMAVLAILGLALFRSADVSGATRARDGRIVQATKSVDAFAEALGRFKFHCGAYPTAAEGLEALALKESKYKGWIGPYIRKVIPDPWKHAYVYEPTNAVPVLLSLGPDGVRGTADDILPNAELFTKPFRDTTWTNDWAPFTQRGYIIVPSKPRTKSGVAGGR